MTKQGSQKNNLENGSNNFEEEIMIFKKIIKK